MVNSKNKGWRGEHEIAGLLEMRPSNGTAARGDGSLGSHDIDWVFVRNGQVNHIPVEVKFTETGHGFTYKWVEQNEGLFVAHRKKQAPWLATMMLTDLLDIIDPQ